MVTQRQWRIAGALTICAASAMALYAVLTDVLRNSVMAIVALSSEKVAQAAEPVAGWPLAVFWLIFALLIVFALYLAALDIRYIRLQYAEERRTILRHTLQDKTFREALREKTRPNAPNSTNGHTS